MALPVRDKYYLRSIHEQIGLFDRKIAHLLKFEQFETDTARDAAATKLSNKRDQLVRTARSLVESGVEFQAAELPVSLQAGRSDGNTESSAPPASL